MTSPPIPAERPCFSPARRVPIGGGQDLLFLSGVICRDADAVGDIAIQTQRVFDRIVSVLGNHDASICDIVKTASYLTDLDDYDAFNRVRVAFFAVCDQPPASTAVGVQSLLGEGTRIEIEAVAVVTSNHPGTS